MAQITSLNGFRSLIHLESFINHQYGTFPSPFDLVVQELPYLIRAQEIAGWLRTEDFSIV